MALKTKPTIALPRIPTEIDTPEVRRYLEELHAAISDFIKRVYDDVSNGRIQHRVYTTVPTTSDCEQGEIVFYKSGSTYRLYANVAGTMKYLTLT